MEVELVVPLAGLVGKYHTRGGRKGGLEGGSQPPLARDPTMKYIIYFADMMKNRYNFY